MRPQAAWNVRIQAARARRPSIRSSRSRISPAALFVNVIARISLGFTPCARTRCATRWVSTRVLPGAGAGDDEQWTVDVEDGLALRLDSGRRGGLRGVRRPPLDASRTATRMFPATGSDPRRRRSRSPGEHIGDGRGSRSPSAERERAAGERGQHLRRHPDRGRPVPDRVAVASVARAAGARGSGRGLAGTLRRR